MSDNSTNQRKKISFSSAGVNIKNGSGFNFNNIKTNNSFNQQQQNYGENINVNANIKQQSFRKIDFSKLKSSNSEVVKETSSNIEVNKQNGAEKKTSFNPNQFRNIKPNFSYNSDVKSDKIDSNFNNNIRNNDNDTQKIERQNNFSRNGFNSGGFRKLNTDNFSRSDNYNDKFKKDNGYNDRKPFTKNDNNKSFSNNNKFQNNRFGDNKNNNSYNNNSGNKKFSNDNKFSQKKGNFFKKSNSVKVKINDKFKNNNQQQSYHKTANTGGNIDKYSIHSMLQGFTNNLILDNEIDDVLGNVIPVKLSGINTANSLKKERKVRSSSGETKAKNFNIPIVREIRIYNDEIALSSLANQMSVSLDKLYDILINEGIEIENDDDLKNVVIDGDTAQLIAENFGHKIIRLSDNDKENEFIENVKNNRKDIRERPPIVTIMGHVDHGKTTLLDTIRKTSVASGEAGGITQHIGAYRTKIGDKYITFLDTPGHSAFTQMRMRGANITDIVIIVVAADDGIMPQTEEAINHAKSANVPIIVAINKIDKPEANIEKTKQMLLQYSLVPEDLGGDVIVVPISAKEGKNIDKLLEAILVQAEILELKAYYDGIPEGVVVESKMDKKRGALATIIVEQGTLCCGDFVIIGEQYGKIKGMFDENGKMLKTAEPSVPAEILGLNGIPNAGEKFYAVKNEKDVKDILQKRQEKAKLDNQNSKLSNNDDFLSKVRGEEDVVKNVSFIIKADTKGSLEAIVNTLEKMITNDEVKLKIAHSGVGSVNESDVLLATTCNATIMTFNTQKSDKSILSMAEDKNVEIRDYKIIYQLFDDAKDILSGKLKPTIKKDIQGHAEVKTIFEISKVGKIAGCSVRDGKLQLGSKVAVIRNGNIIYETKCSNLKHGKENIKEAQSGQECGILLDNMEDVSNGDVLEFFTTKELASKL